MEEDRRTRLLGCRDGLAHALNSISSLRRSITGPGGEYLPPKHHTRKREAAEARVAELDKARDAIRRHMKGVQDALATTTAPLQENTMTDLSLREQIADAVEEAMDNTNDVDVTFRDFAEASADAIIELLKGAVKPLEWIKLDPRNLPPFGCMLVCNGVQAWAVDMVHRGGRDDYRGRVFAHTDCGRIACDLTHYTPVVMPAENAALGVK